MTLNHHIDMTQEVFEKIERYLSGEMTDVEVLAFEEEFKNDTELKKIVEEQKMLFQAIEEQSLRFQLNEYHKKISSKVIPLKIIQKGKRKQAASSLFRKISIAASVAILIGIVSFWVLNQASFTEKIFAANFKPDPGLPTTMGTTKDFAFNDAMVDYKRGDYDMAIRKWESLLFENPTSDTLNYFLGVAYLASGNHGKAIAFLHTNINNSDSIFYKEALYYYALAKIKNKDIKGAIKILEKIKSSKSNTILKQLKEMEK